jgi:high-affinity iron transporter
VAEGSKPLGALAVVVGVAVLREGSEVALFLYGVGTSEGGSALGLTFGGCLGLLLGVAVCLLTYLGLVRIPPRALFATTTVLITLLAAGMAAQAVAFLERANWLTSLDSVVWDSGWFLSEASIPGRALHTLIGYSDQPTQMQLIVYLVVIAVTGLLMRLTSRVRGENAIAPANEREMGSGPGAYNVASRADNWKLTSFWRPQRLHRRVDDVYPATPRHSMKRAREVLEGPRSYSSTWQAEPS